jgi:hypothetical protein
MKEYTIEECRVISGERYTNNNVISKGTDLKGEEGNRKAREGGAEKIEKGFKDKIIKNGRKGVTLR